MLRRVLIVLVLGAAMLAVAPIGAGAEPVPDDLGCHQPDTGPTLITSDVVLDHDITCDLLMWELAPGVTVDLNTHRITVNQPIDCRRYFFDSCNITVGPGATLRNGRIDGASIGVRAGVFEHIYLQGAFIGLVNNWSAPAPRPKSVIRYSVIDGGGITMEGGHVVASSWVIRGDGINLHNTEQGVAGFSVTDSFLLYNRIGIYNGSHVNFENDVSGTIERNVIAGSTGDGVGFYGEVTSLGSIAITANIFLGNGGSGVSVPGGVNPWIPYRGGPVTITGNRAMYNQGHGIDAPVTTDGVVEVVDGGGNLAVGNVVTPECVGVVCL